MPTIGELLNSKFNKASKAQTLTGSNETVATALFRVTGTVRVTELYAVVTTVLGSNVTAAYYRLNDQTAQVDITLSTGTTLSSIAVGSTIVRRALATAAVSVYNASAGRISDTSGGAGTQVMQSFIAVQKTAGVNTDIEFVYSTTNTPTSGVIQHFVEWQPLSDGATLVAL